MFIEGCSFGKVDQHQTSSLSQDNLYHPPRESKSASPLWTSSFTPSCAAAAQMALPDGGANNHLHFPKPQLPSFPNSGKPNLEALSLESPLLAQSFLLGDGGTLSQSSMEDIRYCEVPIPSMTQGLDGSGFKGYPKPRMSNVPRQIRSRVQCRKHGCPKRFRGKSDMERHLKTHSDQRPHTCEFLYCDSTFKRKDHLLRHYKCVHRRLESLWRLFLLLLFFLTKTEKPYHSTSSLLPLECLSREPYLEYNNWMNEMPNHS